MSGSTDRLSLRGAKPTAANIVVSNKKMKRISLLEAYMCYRRHGKFERETGHPVGEVLLFLLREDLILLVGRAAVLRHEGIHYADCLFLSIG
jgi:hypothetical protein